MPPQVQQLNMSDVLWHIHQILQQFPNQSAKGSVVLSELYQRVPGSKAVLGKRPLAKLMRDDPPCLVLSKKDTLVSSSGAPRSKKKEGHHKKGNGGGQHPTSRLPSGAGKPQQQKQQQQQRQQQQQHKQHQSPEIVIRYIDTHSLLNQVAKELNCLAPPQDASHMYAALISPATVTNTNPRNNESPEQPVVAINCEGVPKNINLFQVATQNNTVFIFDCDQLGVDAVATALIPLLTSSHVIKLAHDVRMGALGFFKLANVRLHGILDTQLAYELLSHDMDIRFSTLLVKLKSPYSLVAKRSVYDKIEKDPQFWEKRPLLRESLEYAALDADLLLRVYPELQRQLCDAGFSATQVVLASDTRVHSATIFNGDRAVSFYEGRVCSWEYLKLIDPCKCVVADVEEVEIPGENQLFNLIPPAFRNFLSSSNLRTNLSEIVLDLDRRPYARFSGTIKKGWLSEDINTKVTKCDIQAVIAHIGGDESFGNDNRAGVDGQLHRISCMRDRCGNIYGLTIRIGRTVRGTAYLLSDILNEQDKSILILGVPGSGKTTVIREIARLLSEEHNVCIVDTSNEIAGDGAVPHECIGFSRRMMVPSIEQQQRVMVECVQNHTPEVMIIDEIGRSAEVSAASTVKQRGVRMIASAHGDLRKLMKNTQLRGLLGSVTETIRSGGVAARERTGAPVFDIVVEVNRQRTPLMEYTIIKDVGQAVDCIIQGKPYPAEIRTVDPDTGIPRMRLQQG